MKQYLFLIGCSLAMGCTSDIVSRDSESQLRTMPPELKINARWNPRSKSLDLEITNVSKRVAVVCTYWYGYTFTFNAGSRSEVKVDIGETVKAPIPTDFDWVVLRPKDKLSQSFDLGSYLPQSIGASSLSVHFDGRSITPPTWIADSRKYEPDVLTVDSYSAEPALR